VYSAGEPLFVTVRNQERWNFSRGLCMVATVSLVALQWQRAMVSVAGGRLSFDVFCRTVPFRLGTSGDLVRLITEMKGGQKLHCTFPHNVYRHGNAVCTFEQRLSA